MTRLIIILFLIFIILTIIRNIIKGLQIKNSPLNKTSGNPGPDEKRKNDGRISDAKFEEIK